MIPAAQASDPAAQLFSLNSQKIVRIAETGLVFSFPAWGYLSVTTILCDRMTDTDTLITSLIDDRYRFSLPSAGLLPPPPPDTELMLSTRADFLEDINISTPVTYITHHTSNI